MEYRSRFFSYHSGLLLLQFLLAPDSVNLYFCRLLLGLSGMVISIKPATKSGSKCRLNERESPFNPIVAKISLRENVLFLRSLSTDICMSVNSTWCSAWCLTWCSACSAASKSEYIFCNVDNNANNVNSINLPESPVC